jgi:hypothetical protein
MKGVIGTFEVRVFNSNGRLIKLYFDRRYHYQAMEEGQKHGRVESCRKVSREKYFLGSIKNIILDEPMVEFVKGNPFVNPIAMEELIFNRKEKRAERLENNKKDKPIDRE